MKYSKGFTLIELLVVTAIIGILLSITLSAFNSAIDKNREQRGIYGTSEKCSIKINDECVK